MKISIIIPVYNEDENILSLYNEITLVIKNKIIKDYEIIFVDDCSNDNSKKIISNLLNNDSKIKLISNNLNKGQSFSIFNGVNNAKYSIIVTIDGDGQNIPNDIINLLHNYKDKNLKLIGGIRSVRKDSFVKKISSKIANFIRSNYLNDGCVDTGCGLKVFDKKIFLEFKYFNGMHRFLPALFRGFGHSTSFIKVGHRKRKHGISKYGTYKRLLRGLKDMIYVKNLIKNK